jgi:L,D-transpeptidase-like protein
LIVRRRSLVSIIFAVCCAAVRATAQAPPPGGNPSPPRYRAVLIENAQSVAALRKQLGAAGFLSVLKINRLDLQHVRQGEPLVVPDGELDFLALSPFPAALPIDPCPAPRLLVVARRVQAFAAYDNCALVRWGPTSTGRKETPTPSGLYHTNWRARLRRSTDNASWILPWLVNLDNARGISFHQFDLPGYPASHACVRLLEDDARWVHDGMEGWVLSEDKRTVVEYGTPVVVFGEYDYDAPGPWKRLADDPLAATIAASELQQAIAPHLELIVARRRAATESNYHSGYGDRRGH